MADLRDVVAYLCGSYPHKEELSKSRLTKMVYLADWKSSIERGKPITDITWIFNHYGPFVDDVIETARRYPEFDVQTTTNMLGNPKQVVRVSENGRRPSLLEDEQGLLDFVVQSTENLSWNDFIKLVYSTYPVASQPRYRELDLTDLARQYSQIPSGLF